jgi:radical SAM PhpK family P-methyltransferase
MTKLDCLVIGYNDGDFNDYRLMCEQAGPGSPELQILQKEHVIFDGRPMPWIEAFSIARNHWTGLSTRYHPAEVFNLASLYLINYLRHSGLSAEAISFYSGELDYLTDLLAERPLVVAITTTFYVNVLPVVPIVEFIRAHSPTSHIVVGGPLVDNLCRDGMVAGKVSAGLSDLLDVMAADSYVWESQGEWTLNQLCQALKLGNSLAKVPNTLLKHEGQWVASHRVIENNDLDECSINWSQFQTGQLGPVVQTRTARSCAFKCSFCDYPSRAGALATASIETVRRELRQMAALGARTVVFVDDTFNVPPKRFKAICKMMIEEDLGLTWYSYFRCSHARDGEAFDLAAESGCAGVFLGIESADPGVLAAMHKLAQDSQYRAGIENFAQRGIMTFASLIVGFPGETEASVQRTLEFINETRPTFWRAQAWWANPRTPIYAERESYDISGSGYTWRHATMDSEEAASLCDWMFDRVTGSTWLPLYDLDFWSVPYLVGKGMRVEEIQKLLAVTQKYMSSRDSRQAKDKPMLDFKAGLISAAEGLDLAPARYRFQ